MDVSTPCASTVRQTNNDFPFLSPSSVLSVLSVLSVTYLQTPRPLRDIRKAYEPQEGASLAFPCAGGGIQLPGRPTACLSSKGQRGRDLPDISGEWV